MPSLTVTSADLKLLCRCFAQGAPAPEDRRAGDELIDPDIVAEVEALLANARPDQPIAFSETAWRAFAACVEVGAELIEGLPAYDYQRAVRLVG